MAFDWAHAWQIAAVFAAAVVGGALNAIAGGGSLITFPTLLFVGIEPVLANATNTVVLWPASVAGAYGFQKELRRAERSMFLLLIPSVIGGGVGAVLLLHTPSRLFEVLAPYLVLVATVLLAFQERISTQVRRDPQKARSAGWWMVVVGVQLVVSVYGGFFGAGIGILMLATLGLIGLTDIHAMNGLKNLYALCINGVALLYFIASGAVVWSVVAVMVTGSVAGGLGGARLAHRLGRDTVRRSIVTVGVAMTVALFVKVYA
jgi:uncharacterized protein